MKRFTFRLNSLLMLREIKEGEAARELRDALGAQQKLEVALNIAQGVAESARAKLENTEGRSIGALDFSAALADFDRKLAVERSAGEKLRKQVEKAEAARRIWEQAVLELKTVGKIREKAALAHQREVSRTEQSQLDEVGMRFPKTIMSSQS